ncbi:serine O-acetyltransferase [Peribacillus simplex]|uniref:serine O-acetyltransferase n=1 Tax=Peribacillus simplex TaxID=1478 RepID=UPI00366FD8B8
MKNGIISRLMLNVYRFGNRIFYNINTPIIRQVLWMLYKFLDVIIVKIVGGADIPAQAKIGDNLYLPHNGKGVVIHPTATIGDSVTIYHQVTVGSDGTGNNGAPVVHDYVFIGVGAKILGRINIGDNAKIGANAVVLQDVPTNAVAVGIPAQIILKKVKKQTI